MNASHDHRPDLHPAARDVAALLDGVTDAHLSAPTPCPGYRVQGLLGHLLGLSAAFEAAARKDGGPLASTPPDAAAPPPLTGDWRGTLRERLTALAHAWEDSAAWDGDTMAGGVTFPAAIAGRVALDELVVHGWDLARATGLPYSPAEPDLAVCAQVLAAPADPVERDGSGFGRVVPVPDGASELDRVIGLSGRRPDWTPPAR